MKFEITDDGKYRGVIYKYTNKNTGLPYVGKAPHEANRRQSWKKPGNNGYAGKKIADARMQYGVDDTVWDYEVLEEFLADTKEELKEMLKAAETKWITEEDAVENGYNSSYGDGMKGRKHTDQSKALISQNHRNYQSEDTRKKLKTAMEGRVVSDATKAKISAGNKGKKRTAAMNQAQSDMRKGIEPKAATAGLKAYFEKHGHGPNKGIKISDEGRANMKAAQQSRGTKTIATSPDGNEEEYPTMLDAAKGCGLNVGSVANAIKTGGKTKNGYKFRKS